MLSFFSLDKFHDRDLIAWLAGIENKLHSYLIRQCLRYIRDNDIPILITGKSGVQLPVVVNKPHNIVKEHGDNNNDVVKDFSKKVSIQNYGDDGVGLTDKQISDLISPVVSQKKESIEEMRARLNNKVRNM